MRAILLVLALVVGLNMNNPCPVRDPSPHAGCEVLSGLAKCDRFTSGTRVDAQ